METEISIMEQVNTAILDEILSQEREFLGGLTMEHFQWHEQRWSLFYSPPVITSLRLRHRRVPLEERVNWLKEGF